MDKYCKELRSYSGSVQYNLVLDLLESRIEHYRAKNDDAPPDEVSKNQGAIKELKTLRRDLTYKSK